MQAMILAAGLGTRLLPHTNIRPKPLFPILNTPLLLLTIERLKNFGFDQIVVNCHHLKEQIVEVLDSVGGVIVIEEEIILGTGGGLRGALPYMRDEPILISNGDIYHTVNVLELYNYHRKNKHSITLGMHNCTRFNTVSMNGDRVDAFGKDKSLPTLAYTGLQVLQPELLQDIEKGQYSCIIEHYRKLLAGGVHIDTFRVDDCHWTDMGSVEDYLALHAGLLSGNIPCWQEIGPVRKPYCIGARAKLPAHVDLDDWVCIGEAQIGDRTHLQRCVVWDGVIVHGGMEITDKIVSSDV
ncbi:MAG: mannose-1-phosphate guanylyltransferase [Desulforhopalus sp.]|jgi:mannose-1-phosphate guanylyltransferase